MNAFSSVPTVDVRQLAQAREAGARLIDVREPDEYEAGHVPGAVLLPLGELVARTGEVPMGEPVYVICQSGGRSEKAAKYLRSRGVDARNVSGGTHAWIRSGRPATAGSTPD